MFVDQFHITDMDKYASRNIDVDQSWFVNQVVMYRLLTIEQLIP